MTAKVAASTPNAWRQSSIPCVPAKSFTMNVYFCDGSTQNNGKFGLQSARICVVDQNGKLLLDHPIGDKTNIEAEALAILAVLRRIYRLKISPVQIRTDSRFWQQAINFRWKLKEKRLFPLRDELYTLTTATQAEIIWIPREQNPAGQYIEKKLKKRSSF